MKRHASEANMTTTQTDRMTTTKKKKNRNEQVPAQPHDDDDDDDASDNHLTHLFPPATVRSQLYRETPKLARIPLEHAALIGTTAALMLQQILKEYPWNTSTSESTRANMDHQDNLVSAATLQQIIQNNSDWKFLQDMDASTWVGKERPVAYTAPRRTSKRAAAAPAAVHKVIRGVVPASEHGLHIKEADQVAHVGDSIILDEDDYD